MSAYEEIISQATSKQNTALKQVIKALTNDLSRNLLIYLAEKKKISYTQLPMKEFNRSKIATLYTLDDLSRLGLVRSEMKSENGRTHQVFTITQSGKNAVCELINNR